MPTFVKEIKPPEGLTLAADSSSPIMYELEGDLHALSLVDLEREGLVEYRNFLRQIGFTDSRINRISNEINSNYNELKNEKNEANNEQQVHVNSRQTLPQQIIQQKTADQQSISAASNTSATNSNIEFTNDLLRLLDLDANNTISISDAEKILSRLNARLGRPYGDNEAKEFFSHISFNFDGRIDFEQFQSVLEQQL